MYFCAWNYLLIVFIEAVSNKGHITAVLYIVELNKQPIFFFFSSIGYLSISTFGRKTYEYFILHFV